MGILDIRAAFEYARESVTAEQAASRYGIQINRGHRARCPFHGGEHFNLSFKGGGFNCFVCNLSGDAIEFVRLLFQYSKPFEALKRINSDFGLGIDFGREKPEAEHRNELEQIKQIRRKTAEREVPETARRILWEYELNLDWVKREFAPKTIDETPQKLWVSALHEIEQARYLLDCYECMPRDRQLEFILKERGDLIEREEFNRTVDAFIRQKNTA
jgi:hypothetical protein